MSAERSLNDNAFFCFWWRRGEGRSVCGPVSYHALFALKFRLKCVWIPFKCSFPCIVNFCLMFVGIETVETLALRTTFVSTAKADTVPLKTAFFAVPTCQELGFRCFTRRRVHRVLLKDHFGRSPGGGCTVERFEPEFGGCSSSHRHGLVVPRTFSTLPDRCVWMTFSSASL